MKTICKFTSTVRESENQTGSLALPSVFSSLFWQQRGLPLLVAGLAVIPTARLHAAEPEATPAPIPFSEIGAKATADYQGDALGIIATDDGATLRTGFQKLSGTVTREGLRLESTDGDGGGLHLSAISIGRGSVHTQLDTVGTVAVADKLVTFTRPGLTEEYSVSVDGVRQDFIVAAPPAGTGALHLELGLTGATAESAADGARLTLDGSARVLAYNRLHVTDATGRELVAKLEVLSAARLAVLVEDAAATYPVRIDPTFSDADWVSLNPGIPGANGEVRAAVVDGSGNLYIGGSFTFVGTVAANYIAKWNGSNWSALGTGMNSAVYDLVMSGTDLYAAGYFSLAGGVPNTGYIAKWNGNTWSSVGTGMNNAVLSLALNGTDLYAGGFFTAAGGVPANRIAKWNGITWSALGTGMNDLVHALAVVGADLYAGGDFTSAGSVANTRYIARWNGSSWAALGTGMNNSVRALAASGTDLYAGGAFTSAGGVATNRIAKWNGSTWSALGTGMNSTVRALVLSGTDLYAGGSFITAGGVPSADFIAKWNGSSWAALGTRMNNSVNDLAVVGTDIYAGGSFTSTGGLTVNRIAKWNGSTWLALGTAGMNDPVQALAVSGTDLYVGGSFTTVAGVAANRIAKWNGSNWSALGTGMNSDVSALAVSGTDLYAAGYFTSAGSVANTNYIAKWNGSSWAALGTGMNNSVGALAVSGTDLYAGGYFTTAGGVAANLIAKWNGSTWSALGTGMNNGVSALAVIDTELYAGGFFTTAGGVAANRIAKWNGSTWSALSSGMNSSVVALAVRGTDLYAGGSFTSAGGLTANRIAKWNGSSWAALGSGMDNQVNGLAVGGTDLYAGGAFTTAGGVSASRIAKWNGSTWLALGTGANSTILALAADPLGNLFIGGPFTMVGTTTVSPFIAQANLDNEITQPPTLTTPATNAVTPSPVNVAFTLPEAALPGSVTLSFGATLLTLASSQETAGAHSFSFDPANPTATADIASGGAVADGTYTVTLSYRDALGNAAASATSTNVRIDTSPPVITFPELAAKAATDAPFLLAASSSTGLPVTYEVVSTGGVATVSGNLVTLSGAAGSVTIKATQPAGSGFAAAPPVYRTFAVRSAPAFVKIAQGAANHTVCIRADGTLWSWGEGFAGKLGLGDGAYRTIPAQVGVANNWVTVAIGHNHTVAVKSDGTLWAWGYNANGQLGDGTTTNRTSPVQVGVATNWTSVAAGSSHTVAVKSDGTLWAWGLNVPSPVQVGVATNWTSVAAGSSHTVAMQSDGTLWAWGDNGNGQLGDDTTTNRTSPVQVGVATNWTSVAAGSSHTVAMQSDGTLWAWGRNANGQLGDGTTTNRNSPVQVGLATNWASVAAGEDHTVAVQGDGRLWAWGDNEYGQLGLGDLTQRTSPTQVGVTTNWASVAAGFNHTVAVQNDGMLWAWGLGEEGQLATSVKGPVSLNEVLDNSSVNSAAPGFGHSMAVKSDGTLWAWGRNGSGQLGDGTTTARPGPVRVGIATNWASVAPGHSHTVAVQTDGTLWAWGNNSQGLLGLGDTTQRTHPVQVGVAADWASVAAGSSRTMAVKSDGTLWAWGSNSYGELGLGDTTQRSSPVQVGVAANWASVALGSAHTVAVKRDGTLWAWGFNGSGQLGDGSTTQHTSPIQVGSASNWASVAAGHEHTVAVKSDGTLWAWGFNGGRLGDGTTTQRNSPVQVGVAANWASVTAGKYHTVAVTSEGKLWAWGSNFYGQLGLGDTGTRYIPVQVGNARGWTMAKSGHQADCTLATRNGRVWGFGANRYGQVPGVDTCRIVPRLSVPALASQSITIPSFTAAVGLPVTLAATASSGLPVTYAVSGPATLSGNVLTVTGAGEVILDAWQTGDDNAWQYSEVASVVVSPDISVEQPVGTGLTDGTGTIGFGTQETGVTSAAKTFTIRNASMSLLTGLGITKDGDANGDYEVNTAGMPTTLAPGASTTFTVVFTPSVTGERLAAIHIASNASGAKSSFDIALTGNGVDTTPPVVSPVTIASNNTNPVWAKQGDTVTLSFTASETIQPPVVTLLGVTASIANVGGNHWTAAVTVGPGTTQSTATFSITATDLAGNVAAPAVTATTNGSSVKVDRTAPVLTLPDDITAEATSAVGRVVTYSASAADNLDPAPSFSATPNSGSTFPIGMTTVNASSTDAAGNTAAGSFTVTVTNNPPVVTLTGPNPLTFEAAASYSDPGATVSDVEDGPLTPTISSNTVVSNVPGVYAVTWSATDSASASGTATRVVNVVDTTAPIVTAPANVTVPATSVAGAVVTYPAASATDAVGVTSLTYSQDSGTTFPIGATTVTITAKDAANNTGTGTFTVTVEGSPSIVVEQPEGSGLTDNASTVDFGSVALAANSVRTFTIRNAGTTSLTGLAITKDGTHSAEFTVGAPGAATLAPGVSTTFTVTFAPAATGLRGAALHIASNDTPKSPFDIALSGTGTAPAGTRTTIPFTTFPGPDNILGNADDVPVTPSTSTAVWFTTEYARLVGGVGVVVDSTSTASSALGAIVKANFGGLNNVLVQARPDAGAGKFSFGNVDYRFVSSTDGVTPAAAALVEFDFVPGIATGATNTARFYGSSGNLLHTATYVDGTGSNHLLYANSAGIAKVSITTNFSVATDNFTFETFASGPNSPPVASDATFTRAAGTSLKINIANLLSSSTSDPDGDARTLESIGSSAQGAAVSMTGSWILYNPANSNNDSFTYTVNDGNGHTASGTIHVMVVNPAGSSVNFALNGLNQPTMQFAGIPGFRYTIQRSTNLSDWENIQTFDAPANGVFSFTDVTDPPLPAAYYRMSYTPVP